MIHIIMQLILSDISNSQFFFFTFVTKPVNAACVKKINLLQWSLFYNAEEYQLGVTLGHLYLFKLDASYSYCFVNVRQLHAIFTHHSHQLDVRKAFCFNSQRLYLKSSSLTLLCLLTIAVLLSNLIA